MKIALVLFVLMAVDPSLAEAQDLGADGSPSLAQPLSVNDPFTDEVFSLVSVQGQKASYPAQISFAGGRVAGQAPCNRFFADLIYGETRFEISNIGSTRMACPDLAAEAEFFDLLGKVTQADRRFGQITLFTETGESLYFVAQGQ